MLHNGTIVPNNNARINGAIYAIDVRQPNGAAQHDAAVLATEEGRVKSGTGLPNGGAHMNGDAHTNGVGPPDGGAGPHVVAEEEDGVIVVTDAGPVKVPHRMMLGKHKFGERTHGGVQSRHKHAVKIVGKIGWVAKGIVYALIGGLCCRSAADEQSNVDTSPQGAFELLGSGRSGKVILILEMVGVTLYVIWRFWEGITEQGSHPAYGAFKNFFSFRLSPIVSGFVYCAYLAFCCTLVPKTWHNNAQNATNSDFTRAWHKHWYGQLGLAVLGIAFTAAFLVQVQNLVTKKIHHELKKDLNKWVRWATIISGHGGAFGRGLFFLMVAILMFRSIKNDSDVGSDNSTTFGNALASLRAHRWGRTILFIIGFFLIVYGLYATLVAFIARVFPTPGPTDEEVVQLLADKKRKDEEKERKAKNPAAYRQGKLFAMKTALHWPGYK